MTNTVSGKCCFLGMTSTEVLSNVLKTQKRKLDGDTFRGYANSRVMVDPRKPLMLANSNTNTNTNTN